MISTSHGLGSLSRRLRLSTALAALAGAIVFMPIAAEAGPDACTTIGSISTCVGDQSDGIVSGIDFPSASTTLNVNSLTSNITPATDTNGILFVGDTTVLINSDLRKRDIILDGFAEGVIGAAPGDVTINHNGDIFGGFRGINGDSAGGNVSITATGDITGSAEAAVNAHAPAGEIFIDYTGDITDAANRGISAYGDGDIVIVQQGDIESVNQAIYGRSLSGSVSITSEGDIETSSGDAVVAEAQAAGQTATIVRNGDTIAEDRAIWAYANGDVSITSKGEVVSRDINAIHAYSTGGNATIISEGDVSARNQGIFAHAAGDATISSKGDVTTQGNDAIFALSGNGGSASVTSKGDVDAGNRGILAFSNDFGSGGDVSIVSEGDVTANGDAIYAFTPKGNASVTQKGDVTSVNVSGIRANSNGDGSATINADGDVYARVFGIEAMVLGNGDISITHSGDVNSTTDTAVKAYVAGNGNTTIVNTGDVIARNMGIQAVTQGVGNIDITQKGDVTTTDNRGVSGETNDGDITIQVNGDVKVGSNQGIYASSRGAGSQVTVITRGDITSSGHNGIQAESMTSGGIVTVDSVGDITAGAFNRGISAIASGDVSVTSKGNVTASNGTNAGDAIYAFSLSGFSSIVTTGDIVAGNQGLFAIGRGGASIDSNGNVTAYGNDAIFALGYFSGTGDATVNSVGDVLTNGRGIVAIADSSATPSDIRSASINSEGTVNARLVGISALARNGNATVTQNGDVTSSQDSGVTAHSDGGNASITVKGNVEARLNGVAAVVQSGDGTATVNVEGDVTANDGQGIVGFAAGTGDVSVVSKGNVQARSEAVLGTGGGNIFISQEGNVASQSSNGVTGFTTGGSITMDVKGDVTANDAAIQGISQATGATVQITSAGDLSANRGIIGEATNSGGSVSINSAGNIAGDGVGIQALADSGATIVSEGNITSQWTRGIHAQSNSGAASVTSTGEVNTRDVGLFAYGPAGAGIVSTGNVTSSSNSGILALAFGNGAATIESTGDVSGEDKGIFAYSSSGDASVTSQGDVVSRNEAVSALSFGGSSYVFSRGNLTSSNLYGIQAIGSSTITVDSVGQIMADQQGILALGFPSGASIAVLQDGAVTSAQSKGVEAIGDGNVDVTVSGNVDAYHEGVLAISWHGDVTVSQTGDVSSAASKGVSALAYGAGAAASANVIGNVTAIHDGIQVMSFASNGVANVYSRGNVSSQNSIGIAAQASAPGGTVIIDAAGDVAAMQSGVFGLAGSDVQITYSGAVSSQLGDAIFGMSLAGGVVINSSGNVTGNTSGTGDRNGIFALGQDGDVSVTHVGDVTTLGRVRAIHAQSNNGNVYVDVTGNITVDSNYDDSDAIFVLATNGNANVVVREGSVVTGGQNALASFGVEFGGNTGQNTLENYARIDDAHGGKTIGGGDGDETVYNYGVVDGDFYLGAGVNRFDNEEGAQTFFKAFSSVGAGNDFNNSGVVSPFGIGTVGSSVLEGNFNQGGTGVFVADIDLNGGTSDYLDTTGDVNAGGKVQARLTSLSPSLSPYSATIIYSNGTVFDNGITGMTGPLAVDVTTTANTVDINVAVDFGAQGALDGNAARMGNFFQNLYEGSAPGGLTPEQETFYLALLNSGSLGSYENLLGELSPESAGAGIIATMMGAENFANRLFSCHQRDGAYKYIAEGSCAWIAASGTAWDHDGGNGYVDYSDRAAWFSAGAQMKADNGWAFGFGVGYETGNTDVDPSAELDREMISLGLVAKYQMENWLFGAALSGGTGSIDSTRHVSIPSPADAEADRSVSYGDLTGRIAYLMDYNSFYLKPMLEGSLTYVSAGSYTEKGAGLANLTVDGENYTTARGSASIELGSEIAGADGTLFRPNVAAGVTFIGNGDIDVTAGFDGLGPQSVTVVSERDPVALDLGAGLEVLATNGWVGQLAYDGRFSGNDEQHAVSLKLSMPF